MRNNGVKKKKGIYLVGILLQTIKKMGDVLKKAKSKNLSLLASLVWRLINNPHTLWADLLIKKYLNSSISSHSFCWKNILKGWTICNKGIAWSIHQRSSLNIWNCKWIPNCNNLRDYVTGPLNKNEIALAIRDIRHNNIWNLDIISFRLPEDIKEKIHSFIFSH